ncbi:hypothetical protein JZO67_004970 [Enterococcus sp. 665A]|uniref:Uncharacterized protein n=1 Tax=Candidatus Enterococcus ferrettii TaxID=2815324 RepID=A0ABV0F0F8_9ENTE
MMKSIHVERSQCTHTGLNLQMPIVNLGEITPTNKDLSNPKNWEKVYEDNKSA